MSVEIVKKWLAGGKYAKVNGCVVRPVPHPIIKDEPLAIEKGQAVAICLTDEKGCRWILKQFRPGRELEIDYLRSVRAVLPKKPGLESGTQRQILSSQQIGRQSGCFYSSELANFLNGAILMPRVEGTDWAGVAHDIRQGTIDPPRQQRVTLGQKLADLIEALEAAGCAHRDLASGNVFVDITSRRIRLIDFDSLYQDRLSRPANTTAGTSGYSAPYAFDGDDLSAEKTWRPYADRYALGLLVVEFCLMDRNCPVTGDGGMFDQKELCRRQGRGLATARNALSRDWPNLVEPFDATIRSRGFASCPSPKNWHNALSQDALPLAYPGLLTDVSTASFEEILARAAQSKTPTWPAPTLSSIGGFDDDGADGTFSVTRQPPIPRN